MTNYFVDPKKGKDCICSDGLTPATAFKTTDRAETVSLEAAQGKQIELPLLWRRRIGHAIHKIKAFALHTLWAYGLVRSVYDNTKTHEVSGEVFYLKWPKKRWKGKRLEPVEITNFPMFGQKRFVTVPLDPDMETGGTWKAMGTSAMVRCPNQGHEWEQSISLKDHRIDSDGRVYPIVECDGPGCNFAAPIKLEDWVPGPLRTS